MSEYFTKFPTLRYNQNFGGIKPNYNLVTDIFFRNRLRDAIKNENINYYFYVIKENDTPESLAKHYYGHPEAYWLIFYANDIVDPYYDWPLTYDKFNDYITEKYGSVEYAQTTIHHYEMIFNTTDSSTGEISTSKFIIDYDDARTNEGESLPEENYLDLAVDQYPSIQGYFKDGSGTSMIISRNSITIYDYEFDLNEAKRHIKLIKNDYYSSIVNEMNKIVNEGGRPNIFRELRSY